jgi:transposase-like protein
MNQARRHFTAQEKVVALKRHLLEAAPISDLCDQLAIAPNLFYRWQRELFENAHRAFDNGRRAKAVEITKDQRIERLEAKLQRRNEVVAELLEEHTQLKKAIEEPHGAGIEKRNP